MSLTYLFSSLDVASDISELELRKFIAGSSKKVEEMNNQPLLTRALRERNLQQHRAKYPFTSIRVKFPDRHTVETSISSNAQLSVLTEKIRTWLVDEQKQLKGLKLFVTPPKQILDETKTFWDYLLVPAAIVYVTFDNGNHATSSVS